MNWLSTNAKRRVLRNLFLFRTPKRPLTVKEIFSWDEIPEFSSEQQEADFWAAHSVDARLMDGSLQAHNAKESTSITVRIDPQMLARLKRLARERYLSYQSMMKQWVAERLEDEIYHRERKIDFFKEGEDAESDEK